MAEAAAQRLGENGTFADDLSTTLVIVPSQNAGRQLRERLIQQAAEQGRAAFLPPVILTPAGLANHGLDQHVVADELQATLAWVAVLRAVPVTDVKALFPAPFVKDLDWCRESALADLLRTLGEGWLCSNGHLIGTTENAWDRRRWCGCCPRRELNGQRRAFPQ